MAGDSSIKTNLGRVSLGMYALLLGALYISLIYYTVDASETCPDAAALKKKNVTGIMKAFKKPCVANYEYCIPKEDATEPVQADCPGKLVFSPQRGRCDLRKTCKEIGATTDMECMHSSCGLYGHIDCKKYFVCSGGTKIYKECPGETVFDFEEEICKIEGKCRYPVEPIVPSDLPPDDLIDPIEDSDRIQCEYHDSPEPEEGEFTEDENADSPGIVLDSPKVTDWGKWEPWKNCEPGHYITGLSSWKRTIEGPDGQVDHAGIISVGFKCENLLALADKSEKKKEKKQKITPKNPGKGVIGYAAKGSPDGVWDFWLTCEKGAAVGFQLAQQEDQKEGDDVATDNIKLLCSCGVQTEIFKPYHEEQEKYKKTGGQLGEWTDKRYCKTKQALCGFRPQLQDWKKDNKVNLKTADMTGLNQMKFKCCNVPAPKDCTPKITKKYIQTCDNLEGFVKRPCPFDTIVGTIFNFQNASRAASFYTSIGYSMDDSMEGLEETIKERLPKCGDEKPCQSEWIHGESATDTRRMFQLAHKEESEVNVTAGVSMRLLQTVVQCGIFEVYTNQIWLEPKETREGKESPEPELHMFEGSITYFARRRR